jgi:DNA-binding NtrC family response regulator
MHPDRAAGETSSGVSPGGPSFRITGQREPKPRSVHLIDQDSEVLLALFELLSQRGYHVSASSNVGDALEFIVRHPPDILIVSGELREIAAADFLGHIKYLLPVVRVILTGQQLNLDQYQDILPPGRLSLVAKPIQAEAMLRAVERMAEGCVA